MRVFFLALMLAVLPLTAVAESPTEAPPAVAAALAPEVVIVFIHDGRRMGALAVFPAGVMVDLNGKTDAQIIDLGKATAFGRPYIVSVPYPDCQPLTQT